jgi:hypothetical protein
MANPFTREGMTFYPEDGGDKLGEVWHGDKMLRDIPDHLLSPTVKHNGVIYYVDELVKRSENRWFLPKRWLTRDSGSVMLASGYHVTDSAVRSCLQNECRAHTVCRMVLLSTPQHLTL